MEPRDLAHAINNPLFAILGLVELELGDAEPGTDAHRRLTLIRESALEIKGVVAAHAESARALAAG
jgi:signal transduction histidine kinase